MLLLLFVCNICSVTAAAIDIHLVKRLCCVKMGSLPENPIRYQTIEKEDWERILLDLTPLWIIILILFIYMFTCCLKYLWIRIYKKITDKCTKINCTTEMKCKDNSKECDFCAGTCKCTHKVTEL